MSEDPRAGKSMSKEPKSKSRVKIHLPPASRAKGGVVLRKTYTRSTAASMTFILPPVQKGVALRKIQVCTVEG